MDAFVFLRIGNSNQINGEVSTRSVGYFIKSAVNATAFNIFYNYYDYIVIGYQKSLIPSGVEKGQNGVFYFSLISMIDLRKKFM